MKATPLSAIASRILPQLRLPALPRVDNSYVRKEPGGYAMDGMVLRPGSLEETGELMKEIPLNPIWAGKNGKGLYAAPEQGQIVVIGFIEGNSAWPYCAGVWAEGYMSGVGKPGALVIIDGKGGEFTMNGTGLFALKNNLESLRALLEGICDEMSTLTVIDPISGTSPVSPSTITSLTVLKTRIAALLEK